MKLLFLVNKTLYNTKMSRVRFHGINALSKKTSVAIWGRGWKGYDNNLTVEQNLDKKDKYDAVIAYKPLELKDFKNIKPLKCLRYNEMYNIELTLKEIRESGAQLVICHHMNNYEQYRKKNIPKVKFVYVGHGAEKTIFRNYNLKKEYDITLIGVLSKKNYPLRDKFLKLMPILKKKYKCHIHSHPGYRLKDAHTDKYLIDYAKTIAKSKIVLSCSSKFKYRLGKYVEVPMCQTVLCADKPDDTADDYDFLIDINDKMSTDEIITKLDYYLEHPDKLEEKKQKGILFCKEYTQEHYAERVLKHIEVCIR